jgi:hypothetical protein
MIDGAQTTEPQQVGQVFGVAAVALVARRRLPAPIADDDLVHDGLEQIMQPLRVRAFFEGHVDGTAHPAEELDECVGVGREQRSGDHRARFLANRRQRSCLMHIERDILG